MSNTRWEDGLESVENERAYENYGFTDLDEFDAMNRAAQDDAMQSGREVVKIEDKSNETPSGGRVDETLIEFLEDRERFTPDMRELKQMPDLQLVFVYGTLKKGGGNHYLLKGSKYLGEGHTKGYYCWLKRGGSFPVVMDRPMGASSELAGKIKGEVYAVDLATLAALDRLESNGNMYHRRKVQVSLRDQLVVYEDNPAFKGRPFKPCYMYIGDEKFWHGNDFQEHETVDNSPMHVW